MPSVDAARFDGAWNGEPPRWARVLRDACERATQRDVGDRLGVSSGLVSRALYNISGAGLGEMEKKVLATFGGDEVVCPIWNAPIRLRTCMRNRRRKTPARNQFHQSYDRTCPTCIHNSDRAPGDNGDAQ